MVEITGVSEMWAEYSKEPRAIEVVTGTSPDVDYKILICFVETNTGKIIAQSLSTLEQARSISSGLDKAIRFSVQKLSEQIK